MTDVYAAVGRPERPVEKYVLEHMSCPTVAR